jgi:hypothetical protein
VTTLLPPLLLLLLVLLLLLLVKQAQQGKRLRLADELCSLLVEYAGETGESEGALAVLRRKLIELVEVREELETLRAAGIRLLEYRLHSVVRRADIRALCMALHGRADGMAREREMASRYDEGDEGDEAAVTPRYGEPI